MVDIGFYTNPGPDYDLDRFFRFEPGLARLAQFLFWLHVVGVYRVCWMMGFTPIQAGIRNFTVIFDSSQVEPSWVGMLGWVGQDWAVCFYTICQSESS